MAGAAQEKDQAVVVGGQARFRCFKGSNARSSNGNDFRIKKGSRGTKLAHHVVRRGHQRLGGLDASILRDFEKRIAVNAARAFQKFGAAVQGSKEFASAVPKMTAAGGKRRQFSEDGGALTLGCSIAGEDRGQIPDCPLRWIGVRLNGPVAVAVAAGLIVSSKTGEVPERKSALPV